MHFFKFFYLGYNRHKIFSELKFFFFYKNTLFHESIIKVSLQPEVQS